MAKPILDDTHFVASLSPTQSDYYFKRLQEQQKLFQATLRDLTRALSAVSAFNEEAQRLLLEH